MTEEMKRLNKQKKAINILWEIAKTEEDKQGYFQVLKDIDYNIEIEKAKSETKVISIRVRALEYRELQRKSAVKNKSIANYLLDLIKENNAGKVNVEEIYKELQVESYKEFILSKVQKSFRSEIEKIFDDLLKKIKSEIEKN